MERPIGQRTEGSFQLKFQQDTEVLSLTTSKELNPANNHMTLEVNLSPAELSDETSAPASTLTAAS